MKLVASVPQGLEKESANELASLGAELINPSRRYVSFDADKACFYRLYLQSRLPFRFLREVARFKCDGPKSLYQGIQRALNWKEWLPPDYSFRVNVTGIANGLNHSHFSALQVKNSIVDLQRAIWGKRSEINLIKPDFCFHVHLNNNQAILSLDGSGKSLHKRGYRPAMGLAPLKENLAAGLIRLSEWDANVPLVDPLCGSGTLLIEAASIALGISPRLTHEFLFFKWPDFEINLWNKEKNIASRMHSHDRQLPQIIGCEKDLNTIENAKTNIKLARLENYIELQHSSFHDLILPKIKGVLICNPPYGRKIGSQSELYDLYSSLGRFCKNNASGWDLWLLNGNKELSKYLGLKSTRKFPVSNGSIDCRWLNYKIN